MATNLFAHITRSPSPQAEGTDRARSASEAFLYRRLETLPETAGRFRLNVELPIPFDSSGRMEVDFLCGFPLGHRTGRSTTFGGRRSLPKRPEERCHAATEWLLRSAISGARCRQTPRSYSRYRSGDP
jgi:hypothetical protein